MFGFLKGGKKTIRKNKVYPTDSFRGKLINHAHHTLGSGDLENAVKLPKKTELNDWLAAHVVDFRNSVNMIWSIITDDCSCPKMTAGSKYSYAWADGVHVKKPIEVSANNYVTYLLDWVDKLTSDQKVFPEDPRVPFPSNFKDTVSTIMRRYFRVFAHVLRHHQQILIDIGANPHFNTALKHLYYFCTEFKLLKSGDTAPIEKYLTAITNKNKT